MIKIKVKAGTYEFLVQGEQDSLTFQLEGKTVGQGKIGNDGKITCTKGVDMVYTSRMAPDTEVKSVIREMVRSLSLAIKEEREWTEGKPVKVTIDKVWADDGQLKMSLSSGREFTESEVVEYLRSFLPKHLFAGNEPATMQTTSFVDDDIEEDELPEWKDSEPATEPATESVKFTAPTGLLSALKNKS